MSTGRKSQLEKFTARQAKAQAINHQEAEFNAKKAMAQQTIQAQGETILKETTGRSDVFAVIARDSMETFMNMWNNSMRNVIQETIRTEVTQMVQTEMEAAMKGMFEGMNQAMSNMMPTVPTQQEEIVEFDLDTKVATILPFKKPTIMDVVEEIKEEKKPRYAKARIMTCGLCGESGHNKRSCQAK